jgi:two-component system sensor histidine kinase KdpD
MRRFGLLKYVLAALSVAIISIGVRMLLNRVRILIPLLFLDVVVVARFGGLGPAVVTALLAALSYSYYFLMPRGFAFGIESPDDWFAFITFTVTAVVAGELASRAQKRAAEAQQGRLEIERLYQELSAAFERASDAEAARRNEQLKSALLDALTHNLRTPLTAIKAAVTALISVRDRAAGLSGEARRELLQVIDEESDRLNRYIEGLSNGDQDAASQPTHLRAVALGDVVRSALVRAGNVARDHRVQVNLPEPLPDVSVEPASITEVIYMLLDNASKFSPVGTTITIATQVYDDRHVKLTVTDEGPGIAPDLREQVFEKFFQVPARQSHDYRRRGIGLGLPIARRLVEAQAGRIWIEDTPPGHGTSVAVTLPVHAEVRAPEPQMAGAAAARA